MADQLTSPWAGLQNEGCTPATSHKRKRDGGGQDDSRTVRQHPTNGDSVSVQSLDQMQERHLQATGQANAPMAIHTYVEPYETQSHGLPSYGDDSSHHSSAGMIKSAAYVPHAAREASTPSNHSKPAVGTPQWRQQRKENHKEVERRRRETINNGISEIAKIVPGCEKNKGSILRRAVIYIRELQEERKSLDNERATMSAVVSELGFRIDKLRVQLQQSWAESAKWQQRCRDAGLQFDDYEQTTTSGTVGENESLDPE